MEAGMEERNRRVTVWMTRMEDMVEVEVTADSLRAVMVEVSRTTEASVGTTVVTNSTNSSSNSHSTNSNHNSSCSSRRWEVCTETEGRGLAMVRTCTACREDTEEEGELLLCNILQCTVSLRSSRDMEAMEGWEEARATIRWDMEGLEVWLVCRAMVEGNNNNLQEQT